jgi:uncharacterized protein YjiS (DUF1127 family)
MTATSARSTKFRASFSTLSLAIGAFRAWHQKRRDRRILDSLSDAQLRDIGCDRLPGGDYWRNW